MVKIVKNLSYNNNYYPETNQRKYITIHETANTGVGANADAHANFINNGAQETWHYSVDDSKAVQHFLHKTSCWACGTYNGNTQSISIEMCVNSDGNYKKTLQNTIELVQKLMKELNIPASNVVQHNYWSGKNCPTLLRQGTHGMTWNQFIAGIKGKSTGGAKPPKGWSVNKYGTYYKKVSKTFTVGSEQIETRIGSPFTSAKSGGYVKPKQKIDFDYLAQQDGYEWGQLENNKGQQEFVPIRPLNQKEYWGVLK